MKTPFEGITQYRKHQLPQLSGLFRELANGQHPAALLFACADSRVDPNLITASPPGQLFVHRCVGNLVPPANERGLSQDDLSEASAIEYAMEVLEVPHIIVLGHSSCGAMGATLKGLPHPEQTPNLKEWLRFAAPAVERMRDLPASSLSEADRLSQANVMLQLEHVATYPCVRNRLKSQKVSLHGAWFEIASGEVHLLSPGEKRFAVTI